MKPTDNQLREAAREIDPRVPERIWLLLNEGLDGEHVWSDDPEPSDEGHDAVEYVQVAARQPLSGVEGDSRKILVGIANNQARVISNLVESLRKIARLSTGWRHGNEGVHLLRIHELAAPLDNDLLAQAGGEPPAGKWSEYMRSDAGQLEYATQEAAALREENARLKAEIADVLKVAAEIGYTSHSQDAIRQVVQAMVMDLDTAKQWSRKKDAEITRLKVDLEYQTDARVQDAKDNTASFREWKKKHHDPLKAEITRLREALRWALGEEGEFPERQPGEGAYWWRKELRERAALAPQGQEGEGK